MRGFGTIFILIIFCSCHLSWKIKKDSWGLEQLNIVRYMTQMISHYNPLVVPECTNKITGRYQYIFMILKTFNRKWSDHYCWKVSLNDLIIIYIFITPHPPPAISNERNGNLKQTSTSKRLLLHQSLNKLPPRCHHRLLPHRHHSPRALTSQTHLPLQHWLH